MDPTPLQERVYRAARRVEPYIKTDMVYLLRTGFWGNAGIVTSSLFGLGLYTIFGHFLSQTEYGTYQYLLTISVIVNAFTLTGMNVAVTRSVAQGYEGVLRSSVHQQLRWALVPLALAAGSAVYYAWHGNNVLALGIAILGILTPVTNAFNTYAAYLTGKLHVRRAFLYNFAVNVPYYAGIAACAILFRSAIPVLLANCALNAICVYGAYRATLKAEQPNDRQDPDITRYGAHLSIMNIPLIILGTLDGLLAFHFLGAAGLALYSFATAIPDQLAKLLKFLPSAALPKFSVADEEALRSSMARRLVQITIVGIGLIVLYVLIAPLVFRILFPQYFEVVAYSRLYAFSMLFMGASLVTTALTAKQRVRELYILTISMSVLQTLAQFLGVIYGGLGGLILGRIAGSLLAFAGASVLFFLPQRGEPPA